MKIDLSDDFMKRLAAYNEEHEGRISLSALIEDVVDHCIESWPWYTGDICVHNEQCMYWKSAEERRKENG
jgi:hypothetical protein